MKPGEFVSLFNNESAQEAFTKLFKPIIEFTMKELIQSLDQEIESLTASLKTVKAELNAKKAVINSIESTNTILRTNLTKAEINFNSLEQYTRRDDFFN